MIKGLNVFNILTPRQKVTEDFIQQLQDKIDNKTKPLGSLGLLEGLAFKVAMIQSSLTPQLIKPSIIVFAADHGVAEEGVSLFPQEVTQQMVFNFMAGGAAINCFSNQHDIQLKVVNAGVKADLAEITHADFINSPVAQGTHNFLKQQAMSKEQCIEAIQKGAEIVTKQHKTGCNVIGFGEMGIANTTSAAAIMAALLNLSGEVSAGKGTGLTEQGVTNKAKVINNALDKYQLQMADPLSILQAVGGFEIAMMVGAMLRAAELSMLVLVDGFIASSAALLANAMNENFIEYAQFCHQSQEQAHQKMLAHLQVTPLLNIGMRLGEGSGVAVAYPIVVSAVNFLNEMASFSDAGVSEQHD